MNRTALLIVLSALPLLASAEQNIWRCGSSYSTTPCTEGRAVETTVARPEADVQAAYDMAGREKRLADQLRHDRLRNEAVTSRQGPAGIHAAAASTSAQAARGPGKLQKKKARSPAEADTWRAAAPATRRAKG